MIMMQNSAYFSIIRTQNCNLPIETALWLLAESEKI